MCECVVSMAIVVVRIIIRLPMIATVTVLTARDGNSLSLITPAGVGVNVNTSMAVVAPIITMMSATNIRTGPILAATTAASVITVRRVLVTLCVRGRECCI